MKLYRDCFSHFYHLYFTLLFLSFLSVLVTFFCFSEQLAKARPLPQNDKSSCGVLLPLPVTPSPTLILSLSAYVFPFITASPISSPPPPLCLSVLSFLFMLLTLFSFPPPSSLSHCLSKNTYQWLEISCIVSWVHLIKGTSWPPLFLLKQHPVECSYPNLQRPLST